MEVDNYILCCQCGTQIAPNPANMCVNCIKRDIDITEAIPKQEVVNSCRNCDRFLLPPNSWVKCSLESKELMALLLKKLRGLTKVKLVDASFVWTEEHSKRIQTKLTIQAEPIPSLILQQTFIVEWVIQNMMCEQCTRLMASDTWNAVVQLRQKVRHKRTFFYLEQVILKFNAHKETINIKEKKDGLDFFFSQRQHALHFLSFIQGIVPMKVKEASKLISSDIHSNTTNTKHTFSAELIPICKDDLIVLPLNLSRQLGNISPLVICTRVSGGGFTVTDFRTGKVADVQSSVYWRNPFPSLVESGVRQGAQSAMQPFYVMDVEELNFDYRTQNATSDASIMTLSPKLKLVDFTVCPCHQKSANQPLSEMDIDFQQTFIVRSTLGSILREGDYVQGVSLVTSNFNNEFWDDYVSKAHSGNRQYDQMPDVVLIKKLYEGKKSGGQQKKKRNWKVKRMDASMDVEEQPKDKESKTAEWEQFMTEIENDTELRGMVNLYKDQEMAELLTDLEIQ